MKTITLSVTGMTCGGCESSVKRALEQHEGVESAQASHADARVTVTFDEKSLSPESLCTIIGEAGFQASHA